MAVKRVIAQYMHEHELDEATQRLADHQVTESFVLGNIEEAEIDALRDRGLIVQVLGDAEGPAFPPAAPADAPLAAGAPVNLGPQGFDHLTVEGADSRGGPQPAAVIPGSPAPESERFFLVSIAGPLLEEWRSELEATGAEVVERAAGSSYLLRMSDPTANAVMGLPFVTGAEHYGRDHSLATAAPNAAAPGQPNRLVTWDLWLHRAEDREVVEQELRDRNLFISGSGGRKIRVHIPDNAPAQDEVAALEAVSRMEVYVAPQLHNDLARALLGVSPGNPAPAIGLDGANQIVAVADTGIDQTHPDFTGRIVGVESLGRFGDPTDPHGHGTHVAGSVLGDGQGSGGQLQGVAPAAKLFFQSLLDASGGLGGLPVNLADLFESAYAAGARIHNNSWGSNTASRYTIDSTEVDAYIASHRDLLVVFSAGNDGIADPRLNSKQGFVDWLSIESPASAKNALTVGARRSSRTAGGFSALRHDQAWPSDFPDPPIGSENISGDPQALAGFSSRGPCDDRRIKPDVVAPGTDILSARSSRAPIRNFWGPHTSPLYAYMGGTSMAAPLVAGTAALVRQYLVEARGHEPSAALLKAVLINGTQWLSGADSTADHLDTPNFHQGFGSLFLPWSIPSPVEPSLALEFVDTWKDPQAQFRRTGQRARYRVDVTGGKRLRITLAYTDLPARGLQNNLNVTVEDPTGRKISGNQNVPGSLNIPDPDNNVEVVRIDDPVPGSYLIQISAGNILQGPQDFALAVAGELGSALQAV